MLSQIPNNAIRQVLLLLFILLLGVILFSELRTFIPAFLGSYTLYVLMRKYMFVLEGKYKMRRSLAAALLMFLSFIIILLPIFILINMLASKIAFAIQHLNDVLLSIKQLIQKYEVQYRVEILTGENISKLTNWGAQTLPQILGATLSSLVAIIVMYFILFFMLTQGRWMESKFYEWAPLKDENLLLLRKDLNKMVLSNAIGIPLIAFLQGVVGLIGYLLIGVPEPLFWFVITAFTALLPVVGAALAYIPLSLLLFASGDTVRGFIVLGFGLGVIGSVDNIFRFWLAKKLGDVHPLITVFGVIIGVNMFGFIGIIFGPILISLFLIMIRIYANEFSMQRNSDIQR
jgi:predicted PurR-regulated permease PerM